MPTPENTSIDNFIRDIESIDAQKDDLSAERRAILKAAKDAGYSPKLVGKVVARRRRDRAEVLEEDEAVRALEEELGMR